MIRNKWNDLKYRTKKKAAAIKSSLSKTGGGEPLNISLNDFEQRVLQLIGKTWAFPT